MDDSARHGIAFGGMGTALGVMAQLSPPDVWYRAYLWYAAFALLSISVAVWVWPYIKWAIDRPLQKRRIEEARNRVQRPINDPGFRIWMPPRFPDLAHLDGRNSFALREVAALWLDQAPEMPLRPEVREKYQFLHDAIYGGRMKAKLNIDEALSLASTQIAGYPESGEDPVTVETLIGREELRRFALTTSDHPMFLFKDQRAGKVTR